MPKYGYIRVSSYRKPTNINSQEGQKKELMDMGVDSSNIFVDILTGSKPTYPEFDKLLSMLRKGDTLVVTKLDRLVLSMEAGAKMIAALIERGIGVHILNMGLMNTTPTGKPLYTMLLAFAEFEQDVSVERALAGKAKARENGKRVDGRPPKYSAEDYDPAMRLVLDEGIALKEVARRTGIDYSALRRERDRRMAAIVLSSNDEAAVERVEASAEALERGREARAAELSKMLSAEFYVIRCDEWRAAIHEMETFFTEHPDNENIAMSLAIGYTSPPRPRYPQGQCAENVKNLESMLLHFKNGMIAGYLARALLQLRPSLKKKEKGTVLQRIEELAVEYPDSEKVAEQLAYVRDHP